MLTSRPWGVEMEVTGPVSHDTLAATLAARIGNADQYASRRGAPPVQWRVTGDGSIHPPVGHWGHEVVSPPSYHSGEVEAVCGLLQSLRFTANSSCGLHVHVNTTDYDLAAFKQLAKLWLRYEPVFASLVDRSRLNNQYCALLRNVLNYRTRLPFSQVDSADCAECLIQFFGGGRRLAFNLTAYAIHGTVEYRLHHGTVDAGTITAWTELVAALTELATCNIEVPDRVGTMPALIHDFQTHLQDHARLVSLARDLWPANTPAAKAILANADELKPHSSVPAMVQSWLVAQGYNVALQARELFNQAAESLPSAAALARYAPQLGVTEESLFGPATAGM